MRPVFSRIAVRLLLFNVLVVFIPAAGVYSLHTLERQLLLMQERSMVQQARLAAASLSGAPLDAQVATTLLRRFGSSSDGRIRVIDRSGRIVADSVTRSAPAIVDDSYRRPARQRSRDTILYRIGAALWKPWDAFKEVLSSDLSRSSSAPREAVPPVVVQRALGGRYGATVRESGGQRSLTMYSALPITDSASAITGAVVVSQSTSRILRALWLFRLDLFKVVIGSLIAAAALSLLVSATIARPLIRLRNEADSLLDRRGRLRGTFRGSGRTDEIGDLTRALETLTARLERHLAFVEGFSADVSHEFKNPLAAIRSSAELLASTTDDGERAQLCSSIEREVSRLTRLIGGVREVSRIDAGVETEPVERVDLREVLDELVTQRIATTRIEHSMPSHAVVVSASRDRLAQAFGNVLDNAISFTPDGGAVRLELRSGSDGAMVRIDDQGPGIPDAHRERVFERFFTFRPDDRERTHDGLGLAIAKAVVEAYGGTIRADNRVEGGARFEIALPLAVTRGG